MSKPGLAFGLNLTKKPGASKPAPPKQRPMFGGDDDDSDNDDTSKGVAVVQEISGDLDDFGTAVSARSAQDSRKGAKAKNSLPLQPPKLKSKTQTSVMFGDLSSSLTSRKHAEQAEQLDASVYEYDSVYDSLKPKKKVTKEDEERKPKYMRSLMQAAETRKRDALIAEEKKIAREREAEGEEYEGKEKFVTEAYKRQQEENRRIEEEEKRREEEEAKKNENGGMSSFYRSMLNKDEERHSEAVKAAEHRAKQGPSSAPEQEEEQTTEQSEADKARELNEHGASVAVNEDGQVVDKRQLLRGGLNVGVKKKESAEREAKERQSERDTSGKYGGSGGGGAHMGSKQAMRERQSRMLAEQLEESLKRSREDEQAQREETERAAKSRKTEGEISSAKERYLARKRAAEEAKKQKQGDGGDAAD